MRHLINIKTSIYLTVIKFYWHNKVGVQGGGGETGFEVC